MSRKRDDFIDDIRSKQQNIVFPDTVRNGRSVDVFLLRGSPDPPLVQRIAAWLFGFMFICIGLGFVGLAIAASRGAEYFGVIAMAICAMGCLMIGARIFRNGFPRS